jgi:hypothetical protein
MGGQEPVPQFGTAAGHNSIFAKVMYTTPRRGYCLTQLVAHVT